MAKRAWTVCAGSGQLPTAVTMTPYGRAGRCPVCSVWKAVTKRSGQLAPHKAQATVTQKEAQ
jgi:hypothetical protein